ncbi:helix-turn-helix transcriptional regulator [Aquincola sp. MAHUQ-54]|uniref:Helix-turn-helix transcriptional regulator n=1 Tax=Aquincola agrisoli TaxID=3119538 RepID=A0AAW9QJF4_9BURK
MLNVLLPALGGVLGVPSGHRAPRPDQGPERRASAAPWHWLKLALDEVDYGLVIVVQPGRVVHMNHVARAELDGEHPLRMAGEHLQTRWSGDEGPVRDALADAAQRDRRCMLAIGQGTGRVSIAVVPLPAADVGEVGATLLMFSKRQVCQQLSVEGFARCHGLTAAETQVLKALCAGVTPNEAAKCLGVRLSTVRTQVGSIRAKTGAQSIRDLMQQVARLPPLVSALRTQAAADRRPAPRLDA